ncbi:MAG TPA: RodZ domain-containing protein [Stellaceae bacterium]|nr:RodZ domain-containing protein [Stellaceae bacterium]
MGLFSRIKTPFDESSEEHAAAPEWPVHSVGRMLRQRREELGLDLETVGAALRIKPIYLAALEQDRAQDLPGPTYAVGFIRAYAHYLGFDGPRVLERYKAESAADVQLRPDLSFPVPLRERSIPGGPILLVAAIIALCGYGTWYYLATGARTRPERIAAVPAALEHPPMPRLRLPPAVGPRAAGVAAAAPPVGDKIAAKEPGPVGSSAGGAATNTAAAADRRDDNPPPAAAAAPVSPPATAPPAITAVSNAPVSPIVPASAALPEAAATDAAKPASPIDLHAIADCWIEVRAADHAVLFSGVLKAGETYHVPGSGMVMRVGNAGALAIDVGGKAAPPLGPLGALRRDVVLDPQALLAGTAVRG